MVTRVRQAMVVPLSVQEGANGCALASRIQIGREVYRAMETTKGGVVENCRTQRGHDSVLSWQRNMSESSVESIDSLAPEQPYALGDVNGPVFRMARQGVQMSESDEDGMTDFVHEDCTSKKSTRQSGGGTASSLSVDEVAPDHHSAPSDDGRDASARVKFLCSFGGKIFPRPLDGRLRYVGGDTKIIAVHRDANFVELMAKMMEVYGQALTLKYKLPDEDLDALVSVSSDEDLENMMDEYDKVEKGDGSTRLRVFLFPALDYDAAAHHQDLRHSDQRYVDAVNGFSEAGSRNRMENFTGSGPAFAMEGLIPLEAENWSMARVPESVPVALHVHDNASHIHRGTLGVPLSSITNKSSAPSAPSSTPSSPPLLPRTAVGKVPITTDNYLPYHQDTHMKVGTPYNVPHGDGNYLENESFGGSGASTGSQHDLLFRNPESRRGADSPTRKHHDGGHQDYSPWADQRRVSDLKRGGSHGKLTRLMDHAETVPATSEGQMPEVHLPPVEIQRFLQQQQQSGHPPVWQLPMDPQQDGYRRADMHQSSLAPGYQHQPHVFRAGVPPGLPPQHDPAYRQGDQQQQYAEELLHQVPRSVSSHATTSGVPSGQSSSYHAGSDPSSPRLGFREVSQRHVAGHHWPYTGTGYSDQASFGRRPNYGEQTGRSFRLSNSPPKYRDHWTLAESVRLQQQQQAHGNSDSLHQDHAPKAPQLSYDSSTAGQSYDLISRPQMPQYKGFNPFQDKFGALEVGDARSHQLSQQGIENHFHAGQQQLLHSHHQSQRHDYQDSSVGLEHKTANSRYQEAHPKVPEYDSDEFRQGKRGRQRTRLSDEEIVDPGLHLPESSDDLLSVPMGDFTPGHNKNDRLEYPVSGGYQFRPGMLPPNPLGVYAGVKTRSNLADAPGVPWYTSRANESEYHASGGLRGAGNVQDVRAPLFEGNGLQQTPPLHFPTVSHRLMEERAAPTAFNPISQQIQTSRLGDNVMVSNDMRWNGGFAPEELRMDVPSLHLGSLFDDRHEGIPNHGMTKVGRMSRPSSSGNIQSLYDDRLDGLPRSAVVHDGFPSHGLSKVGKMSRPSSSSNIQSLFDDRHEGLPSLAIGHEGLPSHGIGRVGKMSRPSSSTNIQSLFDDKHEGIPSLAVGRGRLSRPPSSTNVKNLLDEVMEPHVQAYGTQCMTSSIVDESSRLGIPASQNAFPTGLSTGMFNFDPFVAPAPAPAPSSTAEYQNLARSPDLPHNLPCIKTTSTQVPSSEGDESLTSTTIPTAASGHSLSHSSDCGELFLGHLTMTQHLAEDMASVVLEPSPVKGASVEVKQKDDPETVVEGQEMWPFDPAPTVAPNLWEHALDEAVKANKDDDNDEKDITGDMVGEEMLTSASIPRDNDPDESLVEASEVELEGPSNVKSASATAADEAIAHGLQKIKNADLEELRELGSGTFGTVYHGKWRGTDVAIKRIKASCFSGRPSEQERLIADFWREACNLGILHHPNVVAFYGVVSDGPGGTLATVTEYMVNGSLKQVLQKKDRTIDRRKRLLIAMDSAFGMEYLHGKNIVHFDLKCENLLVNMRDPHRPICKVGDLGLSKVKHQTMVSGGVRGTLPWMAPELLSGSSGLVTEKVDVFSFGIVMWELLTGEEPYSNMHYGAIIGGIVNNTLRPQTPSWCDPGWRSLMERCWSADPTSRPSFSEIASELRAMSEALKPKTQAQGQQSPGR